MNSPTPSLECSYTRLVVAWVLFLVGCLAAIPAIQPALEEVLFPLRFGRYTFVDITVSLLGLGMPAIILWAIAWWVRSGKPPHRAWFYVIGAIFASSLLWYNVPLWALAIYPAIGGALQLLKWRPVLLPTTPQALLSRLVFAFPDFRECWQGDGNCFRNHDGTSDYCGVFAQFSHFFRDHYHLAPSISIKELGMLLSDCVDLAAPNLHDAATTCFLENLAGEPCLDRLKPHLSQSALDYLAELSEGS